MLAEKRREREKARDCEDQKNSGWKSAWNMRAGRMPESKRRDFGMFVVWHLKWSGQQPLLTSADLFFLGITANVHVVKFISMG